MYTKSQTRKHCELCSSNPWLAISKKRLCLVQCCIRNDGSRGMVLKVCRYGYWFPCLVISTTIQYQAMQTEYDIHYMKYVSKLSRLGYLLKNYRQLRVSRWRSILVYMQTNQYCSIIINFNSLSYMAFLIFVNFRKCKIHVSRHTWAVATTICASTYGYRSWCTQPAAQSFFQHVLHRNLSKKGRNCQNIIILVIITTILLLVLSPAYTD